LSGDEGRVIRSVLESGALLEDGQFPIAEKILRGFLAERHPVEPDILILNGLPRHVGQAEALEPIVRVERVLRLVCEPRVVLERIRRDSGGDRRGRPDDEEGLVRGKLESYRLRTEPLVGYYRERGAELRDLRVGVGTRAGDVRRDLLDSLEKAADPE
jgi:adenylate kinase family enzyme